MDHINSTGASQPDVEPRPGLLACGNVSATMHQQRLHALWSRILAPMNILCAAIAAAHYTHREVSQPSGSELIRNRRVSKPTPAMAVSDPMEE